jgi:hypothetical protein
MGMATSYCKHCGADLRDPIAFAHMDLHDCLKVKDAEIERLSLIKTAVLQWATPTGSHRSCDCNLCQRLWDLARAMEAE